MMRISKMIKVARTIDGISQVALSEQIGITRSDIRRVESGKSIDAGIAIKIMSWLFESEDVDKPNVDERLI